MSSLHIFQVYSYIQIQLRAVMDPKGQSWFCRAVIGNNLLGCCFSLLILCEYLLQTPLFCSAFSFPCPWTTSLSMDLRVSPAVDQPHELPLRSWCAVIVLPPTYSVLAWVSAHSVLSKSSGSERSDLSSSQSSPQGPWVRNPGV